MTFSENLMAALAGEYHEGIPFFADLSWHYSAMEAQNRLNPKYFGPTGYLQYHIDLGVGIFVYTPFVWKTIENNYELSVETFNAKSSNISGNKCGHKLSDKLNYNSGEYVIKTLKTPLGQLREVSKYLPDSYTYAITEHYIKTIDDLRIMTYIAENTIYEADYEPFNEIAALWGDSGVAAAIAQLGVSPLQRMLTRWAGVENTCFILADDGDEAEELFERIAIADDPVYDILAHCPAKYIEFPDNLSSEITGVSNFKKYNTAIYKKRINLLHNAGKFVGIHQDGTLHGCLELLKGCGFDAVESVTPAPVGDISLDSLRTAAGDIVIWGGLPGVMFSPLYSEDDFRKHLDDVIFHFGKDKRFVLGTADQIPPDGLLSRVAYAAERIRNINL